MTPRAAHKLFQVPRFHLSSSWFPKPNHARLEKKSKRREVNKTPRYPEYLPFRLESSLMIFNLSDTIFCLVKIKALTEYWRKISQICCCPNRSQLKQNQMHTTTPKVKHESLVVAANRYAQLRRTGRGWKGRTEGAKSKLRASPISLASSQAVSSRDKVIRQAIQQFVSTPSYSIQSGPTCQFSLFSDLSPLMWSDGIEEEWWAPWTGNSPALHVATTSPSLSISLTASSDLHLGFREAPSEVALLYLL